MSAGSTATGNASGQVTETTDPNGYSSNTFYNALGKPWKTVDGKFGNVSITRYDARGNVVETQSWHGDPTADPAWDGSSSTPAAGATLLGVSRSVYDANGRAFVSADRYIPQAYLDATGSTEVQPFTGSISYYDAAGRVVRSERLKDLHITLIDEGNDVYSTTYDPAAPVVVSSSSSEFNGAGQVLKSINAEGRITRYEYDEAGRQTAVIDALGNRMETEYNAAGQQVLSRDALGRETTFEYDALGRRVKTIFADGTFVSTSYNDLGQRIAETDQAGITRSFEYDEQGRLLKVIMPEVEDPENGNVLTHPTYEYGYNTYGNHESIIDPKGRRTEFRYDHFGRQIARVMPERETGDTWNRTETTHYNVLGQQVYRFDFEGNMSEVVYDDRGRTERVDKYLASALTGVPSATDRIGMTAEEIAASLPATLSPTEYAVMEYDSLGRQVRVREFKRTVDVATKTVNAGLTEFVTEYVYDADGRMAQLITPEGWVKYEFDEVTGRKTATETANTRTEYGYDGLGRLKTVSVTKRNGAALATAETTAYYYTKVGSRDYMVLPNGVKTDYTYDELNRLKELTHTDSNETLLASYNYSLAPSGRRTGVVETTRGTDNALSTVNIAYGYDKLNRLVSESYQFDGAANPARTQTYSYDTVGNRLRKTIGTATRNETVTYTYNDADQLISETSDDTLVGTTTYGYDVNRSLTIKSNVTTGESVAYTYDLDGRMWTADIARTEKDSTGNPHDVTSFATYRYAGGIRVANDSNTSIDGGTGLTTTRRYILDAGFTGYAQVLEAPRPTGATG